MSELLEFYKQRIEALEKENEQLRLELTLSKIVIDPIFEQPIKK